MGNVIRIKKKKNDNKIQYKILLHIIRIRVTFDLKKSLAFLMNASNNLDLLYRVLLHTDSRSLNGFEK